MDASASVRIELRQNQLSLFSIHSEVPTCFLTKVYSNIWPTVCSKHYRSNWTELKMHVGACPVKAGLIEKPNTPWQKCLVNVIWLELAQHCTQRWLTFNLSFLLFLFSPQLDSQSPRYNIPNITDLSVAKYIVTCSKHFTTHWYQRHVSGNPI